MGIAAIPLMVVELRNFFSFEFVYMNNPFASGLSYFLRSSYFFLILSLAVFTILFVASKRKFCIILFATAVSLLIGALLSLKFYEWYISLAVIFITLVLLIIISIGFFKKEKERCFIDKKA